MYWVSQKLNLILKLYFEATKLLKSDILVFLASLELYNSFGTLFVCFHGLMIIYARQVITYFPKLVFFKTGILKNFFQRRIIQQTDVVGPK